jgi:hypothetical protein
VCGGLVVKSSREKDALRCTVGGEEHDVQAIVEREPVLSAAQ